MNSRSSIRTFAGALVVALALAACGGSDVAAPDEVGTVSLDWFPGELGDNLSAAFEQTYDGQLDIVGNWDNPRFTEMQANRDDPVVDVAMFISPLVPIVVASGLTESLSADSIPNLDDVDPTVRDADDAFAPVTYGTWGIMYNSNEVSEPPTSWSDLLRDDLAGHVSAPNIAYNSSLYTVDAMARLEGGSLEDPEAGFDAYRQIRERGPGLWDGESTAIGWMKTGEIWVTPFFSGNVLQLQSDPDLEGLEFVVPDEGGYFVPFNVFKVANAPNPAGADTFINHMLSVEAQEAWVAAGRARPVNVNVDVPPEIEATVPTADELLHLDWGYFAENRDEIVNRFNEVVN